MGWVITLPVFFYTCSLWAPPSFSAPPPPSYLHLVNLPFLVCSLCFPLCLLVLVLLFLVFLHMLLVLPVLFFFLPPVLWKVFLGFRFWICLHRLDALTWFLDWFWLWPFPALYLRVCQSKGHEDIVTAQERISPSDCSLFPMMKKELSISLLTVMVIVEPLSSPTDRLQQRRQC